MTRHSVDDDEFKNVNTGNPLVLIPDGIYPARLADKEMTRTPWGEKLVLTWEVFTSTDFRAVDRRNVRTISLQGYYNIKRDKGSDSYSVRIAITTKTGSLRITENIPNPAILCRRQFFWIASYSSR